MDKAPGKSPETALSPSQINQWIRRQLESSGTHWVVGEISDLFKAASGHCYFTLKDSTSAIRCVAFRNVLLRHAVNLKNGDEVLLNGALTVYPQRGDLQLNIARIEHAGAGALALEFNRLKNKLQQAGLFDATRKTPVPTVIDDLGIVTSQHGAAIKDILSVILEKKPILKVTLYHSLVQGSEAPGRLIDALQRADAGGHQAVLLTRGGGSSEDLWCFNDEGLAHALAGMHTPVITAIGHERDTHIADLVADASHITPSAAAQALCGDFAQLMQRLHHAAVRLNHQVRLHFKDKQQTVDFIANKLEINHPQRRLQTQHGRLQQLRLVMHHRMQRILTHQQQRLQRLQPDTAHLRELKARSRERLQRQSNRLERLAQHRLQSLQQRQALQVVALQANNPLKILEKGYSHTTNVQGKTISDVRQVEIGNTIITRLKSGKIHAKINELSD